MGDYISFGERLRRLRKEMDLTQERLAERVGCAVSTIVKFENEQRRPSHAMAERLAAVLEVPAAQREAFLRVARHQGRSVPALEPTPLSLHVPASFPATTTALIGRENEIAAIKQLIDRPECQLLTIIGTGGIGKTCLALQTAAEVKERYAGGATLVSLEPLTSGALLPAAIAEAAGFTFHGAEAPAAQVVNYFRSKQSLLVLDSIEHLLEQRDAIELIHSLLESCPQLALLVTSRERLNLMREWVFEVQGLAYPIDPSSEGKAAQTIATIEEYPSSRLFLLHAQRIRPGFTPNAAEWAAIGRICRAVEGLPLGIELAAAWMSSLSCSEIAEEIERGIDFLSLSARDAPERHCSIQAVFDHSWHLLSSSEKDVLRRLSIFRGGFTRQAAQQVAGASLSILSALVVKSLLRRSVAGRYDLHELIRRYSASHLEPDEMSAATQLHARYYLDLITANLKRMKSSSQNDALDELKQDIDNIRAAWDWAIEHAEMTQLGKATWAVWYFFDLLNLYGEYIEMFLKAEDLVERKRHLPGAECVELDLALCQLRTWRAFSAIRVGHITEMIHVLRDCLAVLRRCNEQLALGDALWVCGLLCWLSGDFDTAAQVLQESLAVFNLPEHVWQTSLVSIIYGAVLHEQGAYQQAYETLRRALHLSQKLGITRQTTFAIGLFLRTAQALGYQENIQSLMSEHLRLATEMDDRSAMAFAQENLALVAQSTGHLSEARNNFQQAIAHYTALGDFWSASRTLVSAGRFELSLGQAKMAKNFFTQALQNALDAQSYPNALEALLGLAELSAQAGEFEPALVFISQALNNPASAQAAKDQASRLLAHIEKQLTPEQVVIAFSRGQNLSLEEAAQMALRMKQDGF